MQKYDKISAWKMAKRPKNTADRVDEMYIKEDKQITLFEFGQKAGLALNPKNRWVKMADLIDWDELENEYSSLYCPDNGAPAKPIRLALGALLIKQIENLPDEKLVLHIQENPYMQYFCGIREYSNEQPFTPSLMVEFRKRFGDGVIGEINEKLFRPKVENNEKPSCQNTEDSNNEDDNDKSDPPNSGVLILDATCAPANIKYPQDINLCNEAREKTEAMVETMHKSNYGIKTKPRMDKVQARKDYLKVAKSKKRNTKTIRKAIRKQLSYINRNLGYIDKLIEQGHYNRLTSKQKRELPVIQKLYQQQREMLDKGVNSVKDRIVSIAQPHIRPIVRGKAAAKTEFGAKVAISVVNGYAFVDHISWNAYNESGDLKEVVEHYKKVYGCYPEAVMVDKLYRNRENIRFCTSKGIRISGPALGRPRKDNDADKRQAYKDSGVRNIVESKFGIGKIAYGLRRVMANLTLTAETVIQIAFLAMNLVKRLSFSVIFFLHPCLFLDVAF